MLFSDFCLTNTLIFRSLTHIDFLFGLSLWQSLSHLKVSTYCPYFLLLLFQPILGRSSIRSSFSLSGQVGWWYWDKRRSLGPFYPTRWLSPDIFGNSLQYWRQRSAFLFIHISFSSVHPSTLSLFPLILKFSNAESAAWERTLPLPLGCTHKLPLPGEYVCVFMSKYDVCTHTCAYRKCVFHHVSACLRLCISLDISACAWGWKGNNHRRHVQPSGSCQSSFSSRDSMQS